MQIKNKITPVVDWPSASGRLTDDVIGSSVASNVRAYEAPVLIAYGDVRDVTLGGTLGMGESGAGSNDFAVREP
ncbi:MAG: hypothetical protein ACJARN_000641 [Arenicella sp.]|jgi:hypothetical protein